MSIFYESPDEKKLFEGVNFQKIKYPCQTLAEQLGQKISDSEIMRLLGVPFNSVITGQVKTSWPNLGADKPASGFYFNVEHPYFELFEVGFCQYPNHFGLYLKDIKINHDKAPPGFGGRCIGRMVRQCLRQGVHKLNLLAAGGRLWPPRNNAGDRWAGYNAWARMGFDMDLESPQIKAGFGQNPNTILMSQFPCYPADIANCITVQDILAIEGGAEWWRTCGTGWHMEFDCSSSQSKSVLLLENYLTSKGFL